MSSTAHVYIYLPSLAVAYCLLLETGYFISSFAHESLVRQKKAFAISRNESIKGIKVVLSARSLKVALRDDRDIFLDHLWN